MSIFWPFGCGLKVWELKQLTLSLECLSTSKASEKSRNILVIKIEPKTIADISVSQVSELSLSPKQLSASLKKQEYLGCSKNSISDTKTHWWMRFDIQDSDYKFENSNHSLCCWCRRRKERNELFKKQRKQAKLTRREERRQEREEKRRRIREQKKRIKHEEELQRRIKLEERKLLIALRQLESIRLLTELLERVKVRNNTHLFIYFKLQRSRCLTFSQEIKEW